MLTKEEVNKSRGSEFCESFMGRCCNSGSAEDKTVKYDFKSCEQMMKQFCSTKDDKYDFESCRAKIEQCCKAPDERSKDKMNK